MKNKILTLILLASALCPGCSGWLDVKPYDQISEEELLESEEGFQKLLNGIYIELNSDELYGSTLSVEMIEILGGRLRDRRQLLGVGRLSGPQGLRLQHRLLARPPERDLEQGVRTDSELQQTAEKHPGQAGALHGTQLRHHPGRGAGLARDAAFRHVAAFRTGLFAQSRRDVHSLLRGRDADARSPAAGQPGRLQGSPGPHGGALGPAQRSRDHRRDADEQRGQRFQFPALPRPAAQLLRRFGPAGAGEPLCRAETGRPDVCRGGDPAPRTTESSRSWTAASWWAIPRTPTGFSRRRWSSRCRTPSAASCF